MALIGHTRTVIIGLLRNKLCSSTLKNAEKLTIYVAKDSVKELMAANIPWEQVRSGIDANRENSWTYCGPHRSQRNRERERELSLIHI